MIAISLAGGPMHSSILALGLSVSALTPAVDKVADRAPDEEPLLALVHTEGAKVYSPAVLRDDLDQVWEVLLMQHAGLYRYSSPKELDRAFGKTLAQLDRPMDELAFYRILAPLLAEVRCGHTFATPSANTRQALTRDHLQPPILVRFVADRTFVSEVLAPQTGLQPGSELLSIDGRPALEIRRTIMASQPGDGFTQTGRARATERSFPYEYAVYIDAAARTFDLVVLPPGRNAPVSLTVSGVAIQRPSSGPGSGSGSGPGSALPLEFELRKDGVAYLHIKTFGGGGITAAGQDYEAFLAASFREAREKQARGLVLDIRGNGGGTDMFGALLVSYFSPKVFRYFDHIDVTPDYEGPGDIVDQDDGSRFMTSHDGLQPQQPAEFHFKGPRAVLTDGFTFSTAADVAAVIHHNGLATMVGEECGGGYDGNTSGSSQRILLQNTGISVSVPQWMYTTANIGHAYPGRGVPVDIAIEPTIEDILAGRDPALEAAVAKVLE